MKKRDVLKLKKDKRRRNRMRNHTTNIKSKMLDDQKAPSQPKIVNKIVLSFYDTAPPSVRVDGVPTNLRVALSQLNAATEAFVRMYVESAKNGCLDKEFNLIQSNVITPQNNPLVGINGRKLS